MYRRLQRDLPQGFWRAAHALRRESVSRRGALHAAVNVAVALARAHAESDATGTLVAVRLNRTGVVAGAIYLAVGLMWLLVARPAGAVWLVALWLVVVAVVGAFVPGEANQVTLARAYLAAPALVYAVAGQFGVLALAVAPARPPGPGAGTRAQGLPPSSELRRAPRPVR